jgi:hypothetical protein
MRIVFVMFFAMLSALLPLVPMAQSMQPGAATASFLPLPPVPPGALLVAPAAQTDARRQGTRVWTVQCGFTGTLAVVLVGAPAGTSVFGGGPCTAGLTRTVAVSWNVSALQPGVYAFDVGYRQGSAGGPWLAYTRVTVGG